jgi:hypothetical protein
MSIDDAIAEMMKPVREAGEVLYDRGFQDGYQAALDTFMATAQNLKGAPRGIDSALPAGPSSVTPAPSEKANAENATRAPRGALDPLLDAALEANPGMTTQEVEKAVLEADDRIAIKSIYNRLRFWEKQGKRFRRADDGHWYRVQDLPAPWVAKGSPNGETGAVAAPASFDL